MAQRQRQRRGWRNANMGVAVPGSSAGQERNGTQRNGESTNNAEDRGTGVAALALMVRKARLGQRG